MPASSRSRNPYAAHSSALASGAVEQIEHRVGAPASLVARWQVGEIAHRTFERRTVEPALQEAAADRADVLWERVTGGGRRLLRRRRRDHHGHGGDAASVATLVVLTMGGALAVAVPALVAAGAAQAKASTAATLATPAARLPTSRRRICSLSSCLNRFATMSHLP